jgi:two-component system CheB/CheR fusion protein
VTPQETLGRHIYELGDGQWNIPALREMLETVLPHNQDFENYPVEHDFPRIGHRKMLLNGRSIVGQIGEPQLILLAMDNVTDRL